MFSHYFARYQLIPAALVLACLFPSLSLAQTAKNTIAVFDVENKGSELSQDILDRLTDYISSSLAAIGDYQVIPRSQLKERLVEQKNISYKQCYDQSCQIEIGRELSAQQSLATQILKLGSRCKVTAVLFDLKKATSERGARAQGGCTEEEIVQSIDVIINKLIQKHESEKQPMLTKLAPNKRNRSGHKKV